MLLFLLTFWYDNVNILQIIRSFFIHASHFLRNPHEKHFNVHVSANSEFKAVCAFLINALQKSSSLYLFFNSKPNFTFVSTYYSTPHLYYHNYLSPVTNDHKRGDLK